MARTERRHGVLGVGDYYSAAPAGRRADRLCESDAGFNGAAANGGTLSNAEPGAAAQGFGVGRGEEDRRAADVGAAKTFGGGVARPGRRTQAAGAGAAR